ncbi:hypothetical protein [Mycoavidus sp. B2-EB]|uniref:hypothetical protein n=1 Tax=Mycoavidus sp. B2-EB TaxID=2651972 RepID=UPI0016235753|nr:hypothetical protein [Mycoavidus sp. B2-EB]BBO60050.1 type III secretion protein HrpB7 [Mycoavidus sp. B2-EB]
MKDRRMIAFTTLLAARKRLAEKLEKTYAMQRAEYAERMQAVAAKNDEIAEQLQEQQTRTTVISHMMSGEVLLKIAELEAAWQYLNLVNERHKQLEAELVPLQKAVQAKEAEIRETRQRIAKNEAQIEAYSKLVSVARRAQLRAAENALDEEAEEALLAQRRLRDDAKHNL